MLKFFNNKKDKKEVDPMVSRKPSFAGRFYESNPAKLKQELGKLLKPIPESEKEKIIGALSPHAGYMYSGHVAAELYSKIKIPERVIILSPNHTGYGARISMFPDGYWETPLGKVHVDSKLCSLIQSKNKGVERDVEAHMFEHSLEVQLPFLQYLKENILIVPITLMQLTYEECKELAKDIASSIKELGEEVLIIASSDLNHYENQRVTEQKDMMAIEKILSIDPKGLLEVVSKHRISMCGLIPTVIMLETCKELGAKKAKLLKHATSGDINGDYDCVVGYAAVLIH